jgi:hypothetical protein
MYSGFGDGKGHPQRINKKNTKISLYFNGTFTIRHAYSTY